MFKKGQKVREAFGAQVMEVVGYEAELIENVVTQWQDPQGNIITAKFMESQLVTVPEKE